MLVIILSVLVCTFLIFEDVCWLTYLLLRGGWGEAYLHCLWMWRSVDMYCYYYYIIYESATVHSQHLTLLSNTYTNIQHTHTVFLAISRMLAKRFVATQSSLQLTHDTSMILFIPRNMATPTLYNTIATQIR